MHTLIVRTLHYVCSTFCVDDGLIWAEFVVFFYSFGGAIVAIWWRGKFSFALSRSVGRCARRERRIDEKQIDVYNIRWFVRVVPLSQMDKLSYGTFGCATRDAYIHIWFWVCVTVGVSRIGTTYGS